MPDAQIREYLGLRHLHRRPLRIPPGENVLIGEHQQEVAQVIRRAAQPILKTKHEGASILCFLYR